jgi:hypothetical protein
MHFFVFGVYFEAIINLNIFYLQRTSVCTGTLEYTILCPSCSVGEKKNVIILGIVRKYQVLDVLCLDPRGLTI